MGVGRQADGGQFHDRRPQPGFTKADTWAVTLEGAKAYREAMAGFAEMGTLAIWYAHLDEDENPAGDPRAPRRPARPATKRWKAGGGQAGPEKTLKKAAHEGSYA